MFAKIKHGLRQTREGLPQEAFAIVGDAADTDTWKLPHHTRAIFRALAGKLPLESTIDWGRMSAAVAALSLEGYRGKRVKATPRQMVEAARHLGEHYRKAGKELPATLTAMVG